MIDDQQMPIETKVVDGHRTPVVRCTGETLAELVHSAHEVPIDDTLAGYRAQANMDRDAVDGILV